MLAQVAIVITVALFVTLEAKMHVLTHVMFRPLPDIIFVMVAGVNQLREKGIMIVIVMVIVRVHVFPIVAGGVAPWMVAEWLVPIVLQALHVMEQHASLIASLVVLVRERVVFPVKHVLLPQMELVLVRILKLKIVVLV